jgi:DNA-binding CsgD family transcriptional regulator
MPLPCAAGPAGGISNLTAVLFGKARLAGLDSLDHMPEPPELPPGQAGESKVWIKACTQPFGNRIGAVSYLHRVADGSVPDLGTLGAAAWLLDETETAVRLLREALSLLRAPGLRGRSGAVLSALEWACVDSGRWDEALAAAREASDTAAAYTMEAVAASADLATATVLALRGHYDQVPPLLARALATVDTAEYRAFGARARGLLAEPADAEAHFTKALADPSGDTWPFERAQLQLDYGEWLRRQRRINDAKPVLAAGLDTFRRLAAAPWTRRAEAELRACGVTAQAAPVPDALAGLTTQQREIVILASRGLTNGEIADRLFLSPRTVASHLYRSYPKLGIADRQQLRDLVDQAREQPVPPRAPNGTGSSGTSAGPGPVRRPGRVRQAGVS